MVMMPKPHNEEFELPPEGNHLATCYRVIDLGTQISSFNNKEQHKIMIGWELPDELMASGKPFTISQRFTLSSHEKATLRKTLESWRGRPYKDNEMEGIDLSKLIGQPCMLQVSHATRDGKNYANVAAVTALPKGFAGKSLINPPQHFDLSDFDASVYDALSEGMQKIIADSPEYKAIFEPADRQPVAAA